MTDKKPTDISYSTSNSASGSSSETVSDTSTSDKSALGETSTKENTTEANDNLAEKNSKSKAATVNIQPSKSKKTTTPTSNSTDTTKADANNASPSKHSSTSKVGVAAVLLSLVAISASGYLYWFNQQQQSAFEQSISAKNQQQNSIITKQIQQQFTQQNAQFSANLSQYQQQLTTQIKQQKAQYQDAQNRIQILEKSINRLSQNKPSDWLLHEAEYLIRIAVRTIWLEQDTRAAINLLQDADNRLIELNHPQFLPVRQLINDDITALKLMPTLETESIILALSSLQKQIPQLTLAMAQVPESTQETENFELSDNSDDWRENLAKTWRKLLGDFITVTRRTGNVEPLMSPQHQQNLRENLALKLQQAQWAAREQKTALFQQNIADIQRWLPQYFDMTLAHNKQFSQALTQLMSARVAFSYPNNLASLDAIRDKIKNISPLPTANTQQAAPKKKSKPQESVTAETNAAKTSITNKTAEKDEIKPAANATTNSAPSSASSNSDTNKNEVK